MNENFAVINELIDQSCDVIEHLMEQLGVPYRISKKRLVGQCPVHDGDNLAAWNLYPNGDEIRGFWVCRTHHCERKWGRNLVGFVRGVLSKQQGRPVSWKEAVQYLCDFLGYQSVRNVKMPSKEELSKRFYSRAVEKQNVVPQQQSIGWDRKRVQGTLQIPAEYYIRRGYTPDILLRYDVGLSARQNRVVVPVYDDNYRFVVGFAGRSIFNACPSCNLYHDQRLSCPTSYVDIANASKWKNSKDFNSGHYLYNYWFARKFIEDTHTIILCEGAGDVWRLEESGIHNAVALFGVELTDEQMVILERSGAMNVIVLLDNDAAGQDAIKQIHELLRRSYRLYFPALTGTAKDVGELNRDIVTSEIKPLIEQVQGVYAKL